MAFLPNQPHRKTVSYDGEYTHNPVNVTVRSYEGEDDEGNDRWRVLLPESGQSVIVFGDELSPAPDAPATNIELLEDLLTWGHPLLHGFVFDALGKQAQAVVDNREEVLKSMENSFVYGPAWVECAETILEKLGKRP